MISDTGKLPNILTLRCISGTNDGADFPLQMGKPLTLGRTAASNIVLDEPQVSRSHARVTHTGKHVLIEDLGSRNGIFVGGKRVARAELGEGQSVVIGANVLRVVTGIAPTLHLSEKESARIRDKLLEPPSDATPEGALMSGQLNELPIPDLLQLFAASRMSGRLTVRREELSAQLLVRDGTALDCVMEQSPEQTVLKGLSQLLGWHRGKFWLDPLPAEPVARVETPIRELLAEAYRQIDAFHTLCRELPPLDAKLGATVERAATAPELTPRQAEIYRLAIDTPNLATLLAQSWLTELETGLVVKELVDGGHLRQQPA